MAERYGAQRGGERCPGETECPRFEAAGGEGIAYAEQCKACTACDLLPTKPKQRGALPPSKALLALVDRIEEFTIERAAGYVPDPDEMTGLEWCGLMEWAAWETSYRRAHEQQIAAMFSVFFSKRS